VLASLFERTFDSMAHLRRGFKQALRGSPGYGVSTVAAGLGRLIMTAVRRHRKRSCPFMALRNRSTAMLGATGSLGGRQLIAIQDTISGFVALTRSRLRC
jgi:hypothetical protein